MLSKEDLKNLKGTMREIIREEVPTMIREEINLAFDLRLSNYVTREEHAADILGLKRSIGSLQDAFIGLDSYVRTEFPIFRQQLDELRTDMTQVKDRLGKLEESRQ